jgi:hypothetical protein
VRTGADLAGLVVGVEQSAGVDREAAAAYAGREPVAERLQGGDLAVEVVAPATGEPLPVAARGSAVGGKRLERGADSLECDPGGAAGLDEGDPPKDRALVPALVSARSARGDQPLGLVEAERRGGDGAAGREFADRQLVPQVG